MFNRPFAFQDLSHKSGSMLFGCLDISTYAGQDETNKATGGTHGSTVRRRGPTRDFFIGGTLRPDGKNVVGKGDPRRDNRDVTN